MSHEQARAFGAICTALWPLNRGDRDTGLLNLAVYITSPGDNDADLAEKMKASCDFITTRGLTADQLMLRLHAWRTACVVSGALPTYIEVRFDIITNHLREKASNT